MNIINEIEVNLDNSDRTIFHNTKPISFIEDCAVDLKDLAEYTRKLTEIFEKNGTICSPAKSPPLT